MAPEGQVRWREGVSGGGNNRGKCAGAARAFWGAVRDVKKWEPEDQGAKLRAEAGWLRRAGAVVNVGQMPCWPACPPPATAGAAAGSHLCPSWEPCP